ncbi:hypothetical protein AGMMS49944_11640 [Spirochaetia bacterium]|nr:hypothetical protein AGMMS49944_11640 [Spirochaetia bacterium]
MGNESRFGERLAVLNDAIALKEPARVPLAIKVGGLPYHLYGQGSHAAEFYDYDAVTEPVIKFHEEFQPDVASCPQYQSGKANEIAKTQLIDWPGREGTNLSPLSTHQVMEHVFMSQDEYDEAIRDFTGFLIKKYIPRSYTALSGLSTFTFNTASVLGIPPFKMMLTPNTLGALQTIGEIAKLNAEADAATAGMQKKLGEMGFPPLFTGISQAPFDIIGDFFRGTMGMFDDQLEIPEKIAALCDVIAEDQISHLQYLRHVPIPVKRVVFFMHKGMDKFISDSQYLELYWRPMQKIFAALIDMGATPYIFTEGPYNTRIKTMVEELSKLPPGKCLIHFEHGDLKEIKKAFSGLACIDGGVSITTLEYGTKEQVINEVKYAIDNCMPGGGFMLNTSGAIEGGKRENIEAMFETARNYGKK